VLGVMLVSAVRGGDFAPDRLMNVSRSAETNGLVVMS
jgi:hypothetical protein